MRSLRRRFCGITIDIWLILSGLQGQELGPKGVLYFSGRCYFLEHGCSKISKVSENTRILGKITQSRDIFFKRCHCINHLMH